MTVEAPFEIQHMRKNKRNSVNDILHREKKKRKKKIRWQFKTIKMEYNKQRIHE